MGLSSSKQKTTSNEKTSATTNPTNPQWVTDAAKGMNDRIGALAQTDPGSYIAGNNALLQQAADRAANLGGWQAPMNAAIGMAQNAANPISSQSYDPTLAGDAATWTAPVIGNAAHATASGYDAAQADRVALAALREGKAYMADAQSVLDNGGIAQYVNPHLGALVDSTLANYDDQAGRIRAQQSAQAAMNGAFGGSRYAILEAQTEADLARQRAQTEAGLRSDAYDFGANLAMYDTTNRQNVNIRNADARTNASFQNAQMGNQHNQYQAGLDQDRNFFNTGQTNDSRAARAAAETQVSMANAGYDNDRAAIRAQLQAQAAADAAAARNQFSLFDADAQTTAAQINAGRADDMARYNSSQGLQAAGTLGQLAGSYAGNAQADAQIAGALGMNLQELEQMRAAAPLEFEKLLAQLYASQPYNLFQGSQMNGTSSGTSTTTSSMGLGQMLAPLAGAALGGWASSGFKLGK